jgi:hypothetical protein
VASTGTRVAKTGLFSRDPEAKITAKIGGVAPELKARLLNY